MDPIMSQFNLIYIFTAYFPKIRFNISLPLLLQSLRWYFIKFSHQHLV